MFRQMYVWVFFLNNLYKFIFQRRHHWFLLRNEGDGCGGSEDTPFPFYLLSFNHTGIHTHTHTHRTCHKLWLGNSLAHVTVTSQLITSSLLSWPLKAHYIRMSLHRTSSPAPHIAVFRSPLYHSVSVGLPFPLSHSPLLLIPLSLPQSVYFLDRATLRFCLCG